MQLAHVNKQLVSTLKVVKSPDNRAAKWMGERETKEFDMALSENMDAIKEIQGKIPGWMPKFK